MQWSEHKTDTSVDFTDLFRKSNYILYVQLRISENCERKYN